MKKFLALCLSLVCLTSLAGPKVILKLDDVYVKDGNISCKPAIDVLSGRGIKASLGIIALTTDETLGKGLAPYLAMKGLIVLSEHAALMASAALLIAASPSI